MADTVPEFCIYCFEEDPSKISSGHIFPQSIGGTVAMNYTCAQCNSSMGGGKGSLEKEATQCLFLMVGTEKLGINPSHIAYRNIQTSDPKTGAAVYFNEGGEVTAGHQILPDGSYASPPQALDGPILADLKSLSPSWKEHVDEAIERGDEIINVPGQQFRVSRITGSRDVTFTSNVKFPFGLLARICYECCFGFSFPNRELYHQFFRGSLNVDLANTSPTRIQLRKDFYLRAMSLNDPILRGDERLWDLPYKPFHRVDLRLTPSNLAYLKIVFFDLVGFIVCLGPVPSGEVNHPHQLAESYIFHYKEDRPIPVPYSKANKRILERDYAVAEVAWHKYSEKANG